jgi:hypothetical protein
MTFHFFFVGLILGSRACSALRFVVAVDRSQHLEQVL